MPRRSHAKTRTGCATCKARRIKCKEETPVCRNCEVHGVKCPGYQEIRKNATRSRKPKLGEEAPTIKKEDTPCPTYSISTQPVEVLWNNDLAHQKLTTTSDNLCITDENIVQFRGIGSTSPSQPSWCASEVYPSFEAPDFSTAVPSIDAGYGGLAGKLQVHDDHVDSAKTSLAFENDLLLAFHNAAQQVPSLTFMTENHIWRDMHKLSSRWNSVLESILSFAATYLHFVMQDDMYAEAAIQHRGLALQYLQSDLKCGIDAVDAAVASSILLSDQAAFEGDWQGNILHTRGVANLCQYFSQHPGQSLFASTRMIEPYQIQKRRINVECIASTTDGLDCYNSIKKIRAFFSGTIRGSDELEQDFLGKDKVTTDKSIRLIQYSGGGLGHLLTMVCDAHEIHKAVAGKSDDAQVTSVERSALLQCQLECTRWLILLPQSVLSSAFANDPPSLLLLCYRSALELLLFSCAILQSRGSTMLPSPSVIAAMSYIKNCYTVLTSSTHPLYTEADYETFRECLRWPSRLFDAANQFPHQNMIMAVISGK